MNAPSIYENESQPYLDLDVQPEKHLEKKKEKITEWANKKLFFIWLRQDIELDLYSRGESMLCQPAYLRVQIELVLKWKEGKWNGLLSSYPPWGGLSYKKGMAALKEGMQ